MAAEEEHTPESLDQETSIHAHRAARGESDSLDWIVRRFSPYLRTQAEYRLGPHLRQYCEPDDLVAEVWAAALPKLAELRKEERRFTPTLVRFLGTTLMYKTNNMMRKHLRGKPDMVRATEEGDDPVAVLAAEQTAVISRAARAETRHVLAAALARLEESDREILILRGIEQNKPREIAVLLGIKANAVSKRYARALERLRELVGDEPIDDDLPAPDTEDA